MSDANSMMSVKMDTGIPLQPPSDTEVFDFMKSFQEQSSVPHSASWPQSTQLLLPPTTCEDPKLESDGQASDELRHRFLAAAMAMMNANSSAASTWKPIEQPLLKTADEFSSMGWEDYNLSSRLFSGLLASQVDASPSTVADFPFMASSPFNNLPFDSFNLSRLGKSAASISSFLASGQNRGSDEDFCELCQKHFCNKYYLRKHKNDVHRIQSEQISQPRRRDMDMMKPEVSDVELNKPMEWMNILSNHLPTLDNMASSRKNSMEHAQSTSSSFEVNTNLNTSTEEKQQQQAWMKRSPEMNTPLIHSNAKTSFMGGTTQVGS